MPSIAHTPSGTPSSSSSSSSSLNFTTSLPSTPHPQALKGCLHQRTIALSAYLSELALLDYSMLRHPPSLVASAALVVGVACFGSGDAEARAAMRGLDEVTGEDQGVYLVVQGRLWLKEHVAHLCKEVFRGVAH